MSTRRLVSIYEKIIDEFCDDETMLHEVGFLFELNVNCRSFLKAAIKV